LEDNSSLVELPSGRDETLGPPHGAANPEAVSPDSYTFDQHFLDRQGNDAIQLASDGEYHLEAVKDILANKMVKRGVLPILLAPCAIPPALAHIQVIDCSQDYAAGLRELLRALRVYAQAMAMATTAAPRPHGLRGLLSRLRR